MPSGEGGVFESRHRIIELHVIDAPGQLTDPWGGLDAEGAATSWRCINVEGEDLPPDIIRPGPLQPESHYFRIDL